MPKTDSDAYPIEHGLPIPVTRSGTGGRAKESKYPFDALEIGDSFFVPANGDSVRTVTRRLSTYKQIKVQRTNKSFAVRSVYDPEPGARVWRIA